MSITDALNQNGNATFGTKLPIPYISNVSVYSGHLNITINVYLRLTEREYFFKNDILSEMSDVKMYAQVVADRDVPENVVGRNLAGRAATKWNWSIAEDPPGFTKFPVKGYSSIVENRANPMQCLMEYDDSYLESSSAAYYVLTKYPIIDLRNYVVEVFQSLIGAGDPTDTIDSRAGFTTPGTDHADTNGTILQRANAGISENTLLGLTLDFINYMIDDTVNGQAWYGYVEDELRPHIFPEEETPSSYWIELTEDCEAPFVDFGNINSFTLSEEKKQNNGDYILSYTKVMSTQLGQYSDFWDSPQASMLPSVGLVSYSSTLDISGLAPDGSGVSYAKKIAQTYEEGHPDAILYGSQFSRCNYVKLASYGNIIQEETSVYTNTEGVMVEDPIQAIDGLYYSTGGFVTLSSIITSMNSIISPSPSSRVLEDAQNQLMYVLSVNRDNVSILRHLENFRITFAGKNSAGSVGEFYETFKDLLFGINGQVKGSQQVFKSLVMNPVVKDLRTFSVEDTYVAPSGFDLKADFIDVNSVVWGRYTEAYGMPNDGGALHESLEAANFVYALVDNGYFFFNYEKAIKTVSQLSMVVDVTRFEKLFGNDLTNQAFLIGLFSVYNFSLPDFGLEGTYETGDIVRSDHTYSKGAMHLCLEYDSGIPKNKMIYYADTDGSPGFTHDFFEPVTEVTDFMKQYIADLIRDGAESSARLIASGYEEGTVDMAGQAIEAIDSNETFGAAGFQQADKEYSYLVLRNFKFVTTSESLDPSATQETYLTNEQQQYRIATFEYRKRLSIDISNTGTADPGDPDYHSYDSEILEDRIYEANTHQFFSPGAQVIDSTGELYYGLYSKLQNIYSEMLDYQSIAGDLCAYNTAQGIFNDFLVRTMDARYPVPSLAPYVMAPTIFYLVDDLLHDTHDGDEGLIFQASKNMINMISPRTGTLEAVNNFVTNLSALLSAMEGTLSILIEEFGSESTDGLKPNPTMIEFGRTSKTDYDAPVYYPQTYYENFPRGFAEWDPDDYVESSSTNTGVDAEVTTGGQTGIDGDGDPSDDNYLPPEDIILPGSGTATWEDEGTSYGGSTLGGSGDRGSGAGGAGSESLDGYDGGPGNSTV